MRRFDYSRATPNGTLVPTGDLKVILQCYSKTQVRLASVPALQEPLEQGLEEARAPGVHTEPPVAKRGRVLWLELMGGSPSLTNIGSAAVGGNPPLVSSLWLLGGVSAIAGCVRQGESLGEVLKNAREAVEGCLPKGTRERAPNDA